MIAQNTQYSTIDMQNIQLKLSNTCMSHTGQLNIASTDSMQVC